MLINEKDTHVLQKERTRRYFISQDVATTDAGIVVLSGFGLAKLEFGIRWQVLHFDK
jgi:hypothetical protein